MNTDDALHLLSQRLDGPLTSEQQSALDTWLAESSEHRILAEAFQTQHTDLHTTFEPRRAAAQQTASAVLEQLAPPTPPIAPTGAVPRWRRFVASPIPAAVAASLLLVAGLVFFRTNKSNNPTPTELAAADPYGLIGMKPRVKPAAPKATTLAVGESFTTQAGEKRRIVLPDGSVVYLNQNTNIELTQDRQLKLHRGDVFVEAIPADSKPGLGKFLVETPKRSVTALGTMFAVSAKEQGTGVLVTQGKVEVSGLAENLTTGQELLPNDQVVRSPRVANALEWTRDLMITAESPLVPAGKYSGGSLVAVDPYGQEAKLALVKYHVDVHIEDGFARTTIDQTYFNSENRQMEGTFYFPLPPDASLSRLAMYVDGDRMEGGMAERDHARNVYETIRHQRRDPALLEWVDGSVFKMRVFPLEARQEKRIILSYTQKLPVVYGQATYRFPAGHTLAVVNEWSFHARVKEGANMAATVPSHPTMKLKLDGRDLRITDEAKGVKVDRDVVLHLMQHEAQPAAEVFRWSGAEHEGQRYLMLRYRPDLPTTPKRERRDWVFLFESSGNRDPLVARTQVEVIRALLTRAEHDDTFSILRVGTRVRAFAETPLPATIENVGKALEWLDTAHLIGALNLDQAFRDATPLLKNASNPHLVHVGGGIASIGEQRADELVQRIPPRTKYIGIAVGKRFSPGLMKTAAERTGGLFTQINPDEPITWRGFELASTLNAPRLLNVSITAEGPDAPKFLTFSNILTHGEELAAVAKVTGGMPTHVKITGLLDGVPVERSVRVENVAPQADYLPRTWAKLEIDRLLAENSQKHKQTITDLSKAMYVMTPFTSLLVLENEQMYRDFKVDRGRKDHWAMYDCPAKIPVVYVPDPNQPANSVNLKGQKPHANQVHQTLITRQTTGFLTWPGRSSDQAPRGTIDFDGGEVHGMTAGIRLRGFSSRSGASRSKLMKASGGNAWNEPEIVNEVEKLLAEQAPLSATPSNRPVELFDDLAVDFMNVDGIRLNFQEADREVLQRNGRRFDKFSGDVQKSERFLRRSGGEMTEWELGQELYDVGAVLHDARKKGKDSVNEFSSYFARTKLGLSDETLADFRGTLKFNEVNVKTITDFKQLLVRDAEGEPADIPTTKAFVEASLGRLNQAPTYYGRVSFSGNGRVFNDLPSYAPGMNTTVADRQATVEAEAMPAFRNKRGTIEPAAKALIDSARTATWYRTIVKLDEQTTLTVQHDLQGRYRYERQLSLGLREVVVCDGQTLWHLYPELGLGAKRKVSRFHREFIKDVAADFLPPADELNFGSNVQALDAKTVALVPVMPTNAEEQPKRWLQVHLVIEQNRLVERHLVLMPTKQVLARIVYDRDGTAKQIVAKEKGEAKEKVLTTNTRTNSTAPVLVPETKELVVLPLPLRDRNTTYQKYELDANTDLSHERNACFEHLHEEALMELLTCEWASNNGYNLYRIINTCFFDNRNDARKGFHVLLQSADYNVRNYREAEHAYNQNPNDPLLRFLWLFNEQTTSMWTRKFGFGVPSTIPTDFLGRLTTFRQIQLRWQGGYIDDAIYGQRVEERQRALAFAEANAGNVLGWCVTGMVHDRCRTPEAWSAVAHAWSLLAKQSGMPYDARYEEARCLSLANQKDAAQQKYQALFRDALAEGVLPPLDSSFRHVMESGKQATWAKLMQETATKCAEKKARPVIITLAWQCYQLGDTSLADVLLTYALKDIPKEERPFTTLAAIYFLQQTSRYDRAEQLVRDLLQDESLQQSAQLWRLASTIADNRSDNVRAIECLEKALEIEFTQIPEMFNVQPIRNDYGRLLSHYEWLADATKTLKVTPPKDFVTRVVKAADRWRTLDSETDNVCDRVAKIFRTVGGEGSAELAWDYATTPLAMRPNESSPWLSLAYTVRQEGRWQLTDQCYEYAYFAEPTNAQILWDRAQHLLQQGKTAESHVLLKSIVEREWQPRFEGVKAQARQVLEGR